MWKATIMAAALAIGVTGIATDDLAAQGRGNGQGRASERFEGRDDRGSARGNAGRAATTRRADRDDRERDREYDDRYYDRDRYQSGKANAPPFCRSGAGHPVHGRQWCYDKGYGMGNSDRWGRAGWEDVVFRRPDRRYEDRRMSGSVLEDVLGQVIYGRLNSQARLLGGGPLTGRWLDAAAGPRILQVQAGSRPLAEFYDRNRDGRVDLVMVNRGR